MKRSSFCIRLLLIVINLLFLYAIIYIFYSDYLRSRMINEKNNEITADQIMIKKSLRKMYLLKDGEIIGEYNIALGFNPVGPKQCEGDGKTPEGEYQISYLNSRSSYHLSLHLNYPAEKDRRRARELGCSPGGNITIHGQPNRLPFLGAVQHTVDWTKGCIAVSNPEIREIWRKVSLETPVKILP